MHSAVRLWLKRAKTCFGRSQIRVRWLGLWLSIAICSGGLIISVHLLVAPSARAQDAVSPPPNLEALLPVASPHPLPPALMNWRDLEHQGDYFSEIEPTRLGYLVWSRFPVRVYVEPAALGVETDRSQVWVTAVRQAVDDWSAYLPLEWVDSPEDADISVWRSAPPLQVSRPSDVQNPGQIPLRARSAETRYEVYIDRPVNAQAVLSHRFTIQLRPGQSANYITAAARHELGHALGLWGHSLLDSDVMYFSQVRNPPAISVRDINTLQRIYEQPTRLGWVLPYDSPSSMRTNGAE